MSPAQNALMELKLAAIAHLSYEDFLCVLGETEDTNSRRYIELELNFCWKNSTELITVIATAKRCIYRTKLLSISTVVACSLLVEVSAHK